MKQYFYFFLFRLLTADDATDDEIDVYESNCNLFGSLWVKHISTQITPKLDTLLIVTPQSLRIFRNLGALSEQATESIHNVTNQVARASSNIPNEAKRMEYITKVIKVHI